MHIFDTQVRPILLYACEAWAESLKENETILQNLQKNSIEKFHMSVLKQLLGVHKKTSNIAVLLDTGRHPLSLTAKLQAIKYFLRFPAIKHNRLLSAYHESEKLTTGTFTNFVATNLNKIGMGNIWREQLIHNKNMSEDKKVMNGIRRRMTDISSQTIVTTLTKNTGKLDFLAISKKDHKFEKYLYIHNFEHRRAISKLRTSSHKLEIETGRWRKIQRENRICQNCALNKVEDESHLLFDCQMHVAERKELFETLKRKLGLYPPPSYYKEETIKYIFGTDDLTVLNATGKYISNVLKKREDMTFYTLPPHYIFYQLNTSK